MREYKRAKTIAFYMSMDQGEVQTQDMIEKAFEDGKRVFLPNIVKYEEGQEHPWFPQQKTHLRFLELPSFEDVLKLEPRGKYKLKEPVEGYDCLVNNEPLDLIVCPGVAFSKCGGRLGHGAGFYDSFIAEHEYKTKDVPLLVGVGFREQLVHENLLEMDEYDKQLDAVIIESEIF